LVQGPVDLISLVDFNQCVDSDSVWKYIFFHRQLSVPPHCIDISQMVPSWMF